MADRSALPPGRMRQTDKVKGPDSPLPHEPGIYRIRDKATDEIQYVGQTNDLRTRSQQHAQQGRLDTDTQYLQYGVARPGAKKDDLRRTETDHIARHNPSGNKTRGGNGR